MLLLGSGSPMLGAATNGRIRRKKKMKDHGQNPNMKEGLKEEEKTEGGTPHDLLRRRPPQVDGKAMFTLLQVPVARQLVLRRIR